MRYQIFKIEPSIKYQFVIGTRERPDSDLKTRIRTQISEAMDSLGRKPEGYYVSIVQTETGEAGDTEIPTLEPGKKYLIFALLGSGYGETRSDQDLKEEKEELLPGLEIIKPDNTRASLILLYDCTVTKLEGEIGSPGVFLGTGAKRRPF